MPGKLIAGLLILWSVLVLVSSGSIPEEDITKSGRSNTNFSISRHEPEYEAKTEMVQPEDAQRAKGGAGGGPASIVRQTPARKGSAAPLNMARFFDIPLALCFSLCLILVFYS